MGKMIFLVFSVLLSMCASGQGRLLEGNVTVNGQLDYNIYPWINIYQGDSIVTYSVTDSIGVFPIVFSGTNKI